MNTCISCGEIIPEGRLVCPACENTPPTAPAVVKSLIIKTPKEKKKRKSILPLHKSRKEDRRYGIETYFRI